LGVEAFVPAFPRWRYCPASRQKLQLDGRVPADFCTPVGAVSKSITAIGLTRAFTAQRFAFPVAANTPGRSPLLLDYFEIAQDITP